MSSKIVSLSEASATLGKHRNTVKSWLDQGCPAVTRADRARGIEWGLVVADIVDWLIARAVDDAVSTAGGEDGQISKDEADRRKAVAVAVREEVGTAELLGDVTSRHDAERAVAQFCVALRNGLGNLAGKVAGRAATMTIPAEIEDFVKTEMNKAFGAAEEALTHDWRQDEPDSEEGEGEA